MVGDGGGIVALFWLPCTVRRGRARPELPARGRGGVWEVRFLGGSVPPRGLSGRHLGDGIDPRWSLMPPECVFNPPRLPECSLIRVFLNSIRVLLTLNKPWGWKKKRFLHQHTAQNQN